jgi:hypothetical protein
LPGQFVHQYRAIPLDYRNVPLYHFSFGLFRFYGQFQLAVDLKNLAFNAHRAAPFYFHRTSLLTSGPKQQFAPC